MIRNLKKFSLVFLLSGILLSATDSIHAQNIQEILNPISSQSSLEEGFFHPPLAARPRAYWAWLNGNVNYSQMKYELEEMKEKGLAGFDIFDIGANDPNKVVPDGPAFMSPESVEAISYAVREAKRLGLEMGLITSSSWNAGGPWVTPEYGAMGIFYSQTTVQGPASFDRNLDFPQVPRKSPKGADGLPAYHKEIAALAIPQNSDQTIRDLKSAIDLTSHLRENGNLVWDVPPGEWKILRFVCACTGERLVLPSPKSDGLIIDHFNPAATEMHFQYLIEKLQAELGDLGKTALRILYLPSYEVTSYEKEKGMVWTPNLREEFQKRRGYDLAVYLPLLFGYTTDPEISNRFLFDFNMTLSDLIIEGHYHKAREICNEHGLLLCSEAGGPGQPLHNCPFEALRALGSLDIPRGEFWYNHQRFDENGFDLLWLVKEIACASHIYGQKIVDGESFTSWHHWLIGLFDLKPLADQAMCDGLNRFTFHTGAHNPPEAGKPGWAYHAGTHINVNCSWWPKIKPFIDYLARSCFLLQQSDFVGDVCYYYGDQAPNFVKPKHADLSPGEGYDYDVVNSEVILTRMGVKNGRIVLPDGMSYELLVLPERDDMNLPVLQKLAYLVEQGATVVGPKPTRSNGLKDYQIRDEQIQNMANALWGDCDGVHVKEHRYGQGTIVWGKDIQEILNERGIRRDFSFTSKDPNCGLDYIHRRTESEDIYFIRNKTQNEIVANCTFRIYDKAPELWRPDAGEIQKPAIYQTVEGGTNLPICLPPAGSVFVVFRESAAPHHILSSSADSSSFETQITGDVVEFRFHKEGTYPFQSSSGEIKTITIENLPKPIEIEGAWEVHFPFGWGAPAVKIFPQLSSWTESEEEGIKYFSGIAAYHKKFQIPADLILPNRKLTLDLGAVKDIADVYLNGKHRGIVWKPPFQVDITDIVHPGENLLVIEIANQWSNRIAGDAQNKEGRKYTNTNITYSIMWEQSWEKTPLLESGLLGPVRIHSAEIIQMKLPN